MPEPNELALTQMGDIRKFIENKKRVIMAKAFITPSPPRNYVVLRTP
jgi:hypothetical protein